MPVTEGREQGQAAERLNWGTQATETSAKPTDSLSQACSSKMARPGLCTLQINQSMNTAAPERKQRLKPGSSLLPKAIPRELPQEKG